MDPVRWKRIQRIRREIAEGTYVTDEKLEETVDRLADKLGIPDFGIRITTVENITLHLGGGPPFKPAEVVDLYHPDVYRERFGRSTAQDQDDD